MAKELEFLATKIRVLNVFVNFRTGVSVQNLVEVVKSPGQRINVIEKILTVKTLVYAVKLIK